MSAMILVGAAVLLSQSGEWQRAVQPRAWKFPEDHGSHPSFRTEWWYFTGNLADAAGAKVGYELTFFRQGVQFTPKNAENPWSVRDLFLAHFTVTDVSRGGFRAEDLLSRSGPGLAGARTGQMDVWLLDWSAKMENGVIDLSARKNALELRLQLKPRKPVVLHGANGLSQKGPAAGEASYYASLTDLETHGTISLAQNAAPIAVSGTSWFDHEFSSNMLAKDQVGWDWFGLHLSDGRDLMIYVMRRADGSVEAASSGTLVERAGAARHLVRAEIVLDVLDHRPSSRSGGNYPSRWRIKIPTAGIDIAVTPLLADQELVAAGLPGLVYWEGAVAGEGISAGHKITAEGYVELTGYAGDLRSIMNNDR
ncbi:MAG: lipocalin-like domain-containing protein [Candidatus Aminicenantes bacterium]|nr:lipocalin-like domain-containing protein [Candidatus Aminicenantes bacterium]